MILKILIMLSLVGHVIASDSFIISLKDQSVRIQSPKEKKDITTVTIVNETNQPVFASLRTQRKVLQRMRVNSAGKNGSTQTFSYKSPISEVVEFVSLSPSFQAVGLKYAQSTYEIP